MKLAVSEDFNGVHSVIAQEIEIFITTAVRTSNSSS
jgi:hypothetical protein